MAGQLPGDIDGITRHIPDIPVPQHVGFLACLSDIRNSEENLLILCCFPCHRKTEERTYVSSGYEVILHGESTSNRPLNKADQVFFHLPDTCTLLEKENTFLTYVLILILILILMLSLIAHKASFFMEPLHKGRGSQCVY